MEKIKEIWKGIKECEWGMCIKLANIYNVNISVISDIKKNKNWTHIKI